MASYTITDTQLNQIKSDAQAVVDAVNALVPDAVDPAVLQQQLTDMTADRDAQKLRADTAEQRLADLNKDIDAAQAKD